MSIALGRVIAHHYGTTPPADQNDTWYVTTTDDPNTWDVIDERFYWNSLAQWISRSAPVATPFDSLAAVKAYAGESTTILFNTSYDNLLGGGGSMIDVSILLKFDDTELSRGGNDLSKIHSTAKSGHWRMIASSSEIVFNHDAGSGAGTTILVDAIFNDLRLEDVKIVDVNQDLRFFFSSMQSGPPDRINFSSAIYGPIKIQLI